ncbi:uncharacterized protein LOC117117624 [Anneissia japonica]|uniref:uncharacterized protein LOC117117624 n=1 Tax=Anneissia japonica TaxID=1529436 RepID=UPI0014255887|nr:uncharacterized protein LOC117117624 [Anneissia japonica]
MLNRKYYDCLTTAKKNKLDKLKRARKSSTATNSSPDTSKLVVTIPSDLELIAEERSVLSKGLSFVPKRETIDEFQVKYDLEQYYRKLRLKAHFHNQDTLTNKTDEFTCLVSNNSNWTPPLGKFAALDLYINKCRHDINNLNLKRHVRSKNLSRGELNALRSLKNNHNLNIKPADKGGATVVWQKDLYIAEGLRQLSDATTYEQTPTDTTAEDQLRVSTTINNLIKEGELPPNAKCLINSNPTCARFYMLPKIHKTDTPGRPIVSCCNCPTVIISEFLDNVLSPMVQRLPTYIKDSKEALVLFDQFQFSGDHRLIFTMNVTSLYTSIPISDGLTALKYFLESDNPTSHATSTLIRLAELVLTTASFTFNGSYYRQLTGVSMGTRMGTSFACLFMGYLEQQIFNEYDGTKPLLFKRYIDDCVGAASCSYDELTNFINYMNSFHPAIKFTHEISYTNVTFLDIDVSIKGSTLSTSVYYKPTDAHTYLNYESSHPPKCKDSIPYSQLVRLRRICKQDDDFKTRAKEMMSFFSNRGYPTNITDGCLNKINKMTREIALQPRESATSTDRIPLVLTYHPIAKQVAEVITRNFEILSSDQATSNVFTSPPMHAYRRDKNFKETLVHSNVKSTHNPPPIGSTTCLLYTSRCV